MSTITEKTPLKKLVDTYPLASMVLLKHGLDFCCGGHDSLAEACEASEVDLDQVLHELKPSMAAPPERPWSSAPIEELIAHILDAYHAPLPEMLSHIEVLVSRVAETHGHKDPKRLGALKDTVFSLSRDLVEHMMKEEQILFPWILSNREPRPMAPIQVMLMEHDSAGRHLKQIEDLTDNFQTPNGACPTWRSLYAGLQNLNKELRTHIHLENNILFPRAAQ
ncbi:MAG TPA: iron-sulfur cluster repair di-iron protein [Planctomycetota bacterium]|jgi:regulator of cell morphogenesis and NO signaling|nr:iron-sulfur cluster repair di-iron protein [Planctomycetota bacterium]